MSETTILAIVTVACTAGIPLITTVIKIIEATVGSYAEQKRMITDRQLQALEEYAEIVFRCSVGTEDGKPYKQMGNIYLYIDRSLWGKLDAINSYLNNYDRDNAVREFSKLLDLLKLPDRYIRSTSPKQIQDQSQQRLR